MITAKAPGKIIISGEHAVVYKNPALARAINIFSTTSITKSPQKKISLNLVNLKYNAEFAFGQIVRHTEIIRNRYISFLEHKISIKNILRHPSELIIYTIGSFISFFSLSLIEGFAIEIDSQIPGGYGLGSSAAVIVSILKALIIFFAIKTDETTLWHIGRSIENLQHGLSSGLDIYLALNGGVVYFAEGKFSSRKITEVPMQFINTGKPEASTGVSVSSVAAKINNAITLNRFSDVTRALDIAFGNHDSTLIKKYIHENHILLEEIGVVPLKVSNFIARLESENIAAKISGSGAVCGDNAGIVLVIGNDNIDDIVQEFGYEIFNINGEENV